jgi:glycosyltransferase involved in cell wall biosynthesis
MGNKWGQSQLIATPRERRPNKLTLTPLILMIGSSRATRGGIASMVNVYFAHGLFERWNARYLETHCDGSKARKALKAAASWAAFMARLASGSVALLHAHIASDASFWRKALFVLPARWAGVPYILHMHGGDFERFYRERCGPLGRRVLRSLYGRAAVVVALSERWRDALAAAIPGVRVIVVPNPVEMPRWQAAPDRAAASVLYLGVLKEAKGVSDLLRAWVAVSAAHPSARLVLAGSGAAAEARALAGELGVAERVELPGWTSGDAKAALLRAASVFVLPSHFEALPMALLEAMAAGLPVVATRVGGIPDVIDDGRDGVLVPPGDPDALARALDDLLGDPARRRALGHEARRRARESLSADVVVPQIEALWEGLAPGAKRTIGTPVACP